ncbi:MAG TPA: acyl-CoA dehydrogenase family protein [Acidimicrobiales bacterium]|nr:acyl-CoA dehydrogenase family protein [Acidimicrobiales bacterium]
MDLLPVPPASIPTPYRTEDRTAIRDLARDFAMREVLPVANELDPVQGEIPLELRRAMGEMGFFGILIPEEYGGLGLGLFEYCLVTEELARAWMSCASIIARGNGLGGGFSQDQRRRLLPLMAKGELLGAFALSEPDAGSDVASIRCRAELQGDEYVINGQKMWCTFADQANFIVLVARTTPYDPANRYSGIRNFFIPKEPGSFPAGISGNPVRKIGYHGWKTWELSFDDFRLPAENLLGRQAEGDDRAGFRNVTRGLSVARVHTAARSIGLARAGLEDAVAYAQQRRQFDRPISDFQAIRFKIASMAAEIEACRALMYQVAADADAGVAVDAQASMVKYLASEMSERVTSEALQIHGGAGYTTDFAVERHWRDARLTKIFEGTSEIQLRIISDRLLPRPG